MRKGENNLGHHGVVAPVVAKEDLNGIGSPLAPPSFGLRLAKIFDELRSGVGFRLLAAVLLFSSVVTLPQSR